MILAHQDLVKGSNIHVTSFFIHAQFLLTFFHDARNLKKGNLELDKVLKNEKILTP